MKRIEPGEEQESVWDYPRPPRLELFEGAIRIEFNGTEIAAVNSSFRVMETSHPPVYYIPMNAFLAGSLVPASGSSFCEWKGMAQYYSILWNGKTSLNAAWGYPNPNKAFHDIQDHVAVYAGRVDVCFVNGERVTPQPGEFYGGWITSNIVGPFKGESGTWGW
ncbi:MAG: DUF427 domain-containing protein [Chthonomonadales bacterium]